MRKTLNIAIASFVFFLVFALVDNTLASWYAGIERIPNANGITALISTPLNPLNLVEAGQSGVSNWVSTLYSDANGKDWIQAGWKYYHWYPNQGQLPKQYIEWCFNYISGQSTCTMYDTFATQSWGTTVDYWVSRTNNTSNWCGITAGIQRICINHLHSGPVKVMAKSEIHDSSQNPLNTYFNQIKYKSPSNNSWYSFDTQRIIDEDFSYDAQICQISISVLID